MENKLLIPKWKKRTEETHKIHQEKYKNGTYDYVFLGDSMMERWETTGKVYFDKLCENHSIALLGVGGDGIENLLYRLEEERSILSTIEIRKGIFLFIGINNVQTRSVEHIFSAIKHVVEKLNTFNVPVTVLPLSYRSDVDPEKIRSLNSKLFELVETEKSFSAVFEMINSHRYYADHVHFSEDGYRVWFESMRL